ncbi:NIPSNAP family protein [Bordetella petrii]|uniref:NIPSNAP family protein n=1 Tax=Bordetella petrii TaxID=94624 RepID=UPI001E32E2FC|nr:NIPSNAP family protein [Bordetella petrii]MCD0504894.1 NIPSNAP family protein [Bordetella petrii]
MIHEYRTYTIEPGQLDTYLALAESRVVPIRQSDYGRLVGFWTSESGMLNQVHHIWEYTSIDQRQQLRRDLSENRRWCDEFLAGAWPTMQTQEVRFMNPQGRIAQIAGPSAFYERRIYRCPAGKFADLGRAVQQRHRDAAASLMGVWTSESPQPNEVVEIVAYPDLRTRLADRITAAPQRDWLREHAKILQQVESAFLLPIGISPAQ